jgi:cytochrome P450
MSSTSIEQGDAVSFIRGSTSALTVAPEHVPADLVHSLDHWNDETFLAHPLDYWDDIREKFRVFWSPTYGGFWCLTRYEDISRAFLSPEIFSSAAHTIPPREARQVPITLDPPEHSWYRRLLNPHLAPGTVANLEGVIRKHCHALVDAIRAKGRCDFVADFAELLPLRSFLELVGLPAEHDRFLAWHRTISHGLGNTPESFAEFERANADATTYLSKYIVECEASPGTDIVSALLTHEEAGERLSRDDVLSITKLLFVAGFGTVTSALAWSWYYLARNPEQRSLLRDEPALIAGAAEELLRYHAFILDARVLTRDVSWAGVDMKAGEMVMLPTGSACRDERRFPDPKKVDFRRKDNRHLAFGAGLHRCVGIHFARVQLQTALEVWHETIPTYRVIGSEPVQFSGGSNSGLRCLPLFAAE